MGPEVALWNKCRQGNQEARHALIRRFEPLVYLTSRKRLQRVPEALREDMEGAGRLGLIKAVDGYDPEKGVKFETFAITKIRGQMLEFLRQDDWAPRSVRAAERLGLACPWERVSLEAIVYGDGTSDDLTYLDGLSDWEDTPEVIVPERIEAEVVRTLVRCLPRMERKVLEMLYWQGETSSVIARQLGLSQSRVGQIRERAEFFLRQTLEVSGALAAA